MGEVVSLEEFRKNKEIGIRKGKSHLMDHRADAIRYMRVPDLFGLIRSKRRMEDEDREEGDDIA